MDERLYIDFETWSKVNLKLQGGLAYSRHPSTDPICMTYAFNNEEPEIIINYLDGHFKLPERISDHVSDGLRVYAHSAIFDYRIWNYVCRRLYNWLPLKLAQCTDTMALCLVCQIPASLEKAGEALGIEFPKLKDGKALIRKLCGPKHKYHPNGPMRAYFDRFFVYAKGDIKAMRSIVVDKLPREELIPREQALWELTVKMNTRGLPIDYEAVEKIKEYLSEYVKNSAHKVLDLTDGCISTVNQVQKIKDWCFDQDYPMENLTADSVKKAIADPGCPSHVKQMMLLRQELGRSSTAKYTKLSQLAYKWRGKYYVFDNLLHHGAGTGRWSGQGFQAHNLPRAKVDRPVYYINKFLNDEVIDQPMSVAKALIRPMIRANDGDLLFVEDYSSIENRVLHWLADDYETLEDFKNGVDQYKTMAAARYGVAYDNVTKPQRQMGKVIILGCGFGMGGDKFVATADEQFGLIIPLEEGKLAVKAYRERYPLVVALWRNLKTAACTTVLTGQRTRVGRIMFALFKVKNITWLAMVLPSGKALYYMAPEVKAMHIPGWEHMGRVPTVTHLGTNTSPKGGNKFCRLKLIPGRITENAVQGTAREAMGQGLLNVDKNMPSMNLILSVHDEGVGIGLDDIMYELNEYRLEAFGDQLCDISWADGLPLKAEGYYGYRYKKD